MARQDQHTHSKRLLIRTEIEGEPLVITEKQRFTVYRGKDIPTACIRWKGLHQIRWGDKEFLAVESVISDGGPSLGVSFAYEEVREVPPTREEIEENRANINQVLREICGCEVTNWGTRGEKAPCGTG